MTWQNFQKLDDVIDIFFIFVVCAGKSSLKWLGITGKGKGCIGMHIRRGDVCTEKDRSSRWCIPFRHYMHAAKIIKEKFVRQFPGSNMNFFCSQIWL